MAYRVRRGKPAEALALDQRMPEDDRCLHGDVGPEAVVWVVETTEGECAGYAVMRPAEHHKGCLYSAACAVLPEHQGHRLQRRLLRARQRYARKMGMPIITYTWNNNCPSINSLVGAGFRSWAPEVTWVGVSDVCYWRWDPEK